MKTFAVQAIPPGSPQPQFVIIAADTPQQALALAAQQSVDTGQPDTALVAVFGLEDLENLVEAVRAAQQQIDSHR